MDKRHPVRIEAARNGMKKRVVMIDPDMLKHADRNDAIISLLRFAIIAELKLYLVFKPVLLRALPRDLNCSCERVMPVTWAP